MMKKFEIRWELPKCDTQTQIALVDLPNAGWPQPPVCLTTTKKSAEYDRMRCACSEKNQSREDVDQSESSSLGYLHYFYYLKVHKSQSLGLSYLSDDKSSQ